MIALVERECGQWYKVICDVMGVSVNGEENTTIAAAIMVVL
jgi:hypothetical protein